METIKVNMNPNPLDVQTIHASQNDTEARQWEFELHNNGELIDTSDVKEQMVFKSYKGGTEQLLPENGSTPTTSPFKGDIRYPQGLLSDQEFLYRESPTEEDGLAKLTRIKGNTLAFNQLVNNGNFADTSAWGKYLATLTVSGNVGTVTATGKNGSASQNIVVPVGHKLLFIVTAQSYTNSNTTCRIRDVASGSTTNTQQVTLSTTSKTYALMHTVSANTSYIQIVVGQDENTSGWGGIKISNVMLIDLTLLNSSVIQDYNSFKSYFPLSYYPYQSTLLSFNGTAIKTVGKNLLPQNGIATTTNGVTFVPQADGSVDISGTATANAYFNLYSWITTTELLPRGKQLRISGGSSNTKFTVGYRNTDGTGTVLGEDNGNGATITIPVGEYQIYVAYRVLSGITINETSRPMVRFSDADSTYEPYTSSTLSLPISTYFPTGMKSAGTVYDELTPRKAEIKVGTVDLGTLNYTYDSTVPRFVTTDLSSTVKAPSSTSVKANVVSIYNTVSFDTLYSTKANMSLAINASGNVSIINTAYTTIADFKSAMSGVYLYYELATPTETPITTASLVTENTEIPLSNEDGVLIGKCTEQLSSESGFFDAKIKLTDADGECYSNKIQLHVERSPQ